MEEQINDPITRAAVAEHASDRNSILDAVITRLRSDDRIRAAWLWGSFGRGDADSLSDLDIWLAVPDDLSSQMTTPLLDCLAAAGEIVSIDAQPKNAPVGGGGYIGCLYAGRRGLLQVDLYWQTLSTIDGIPNVADQLPGLPGASAAMREIFNRIGEPIPTVRAAPQDAGDAGDKFTSISRVEHCVRFTYLMLSIAAKYLARDPKSDMKLMLYPKVCFGEAVHHLSADSIVGEVDWSIPATSAEKIGRLRHLVAKTDILAQHLYSVGSPISPQYGLYLGLYLDLVNGILNAHTEQES